MITLKVSVPAPRENSVEHVRTTVGFPEIGALARQPATL